MGHALFLCYFFHCPIEARLHVKAWSVFAVEEVVERFSLDFCAFCKFGSGDTVFEHEIEYFFFVNDCIHLFVKFLVFVTRFYSKFIFLSIVIPSDTKFLFFFKKFLAFFVIVQFVFIRCYSLLSAGDTFVGS